MFEDIVGNDKIKEFLKNAIENKSASYSYMFVGQAGIGKKMIAREFARNVMKSTNLSQNILTNLDYLEIEPDGNLIKVAQIRNLQEKIAEKPVNSEKKVYVINDAEKMTEESQNCLLKTLEEPPKYAIIILIVSNESSILETIKSRCIILRFNKLTDDEIKKYLESNYKKGKEISIEVIQVLNGSLKNIDIIEQQTEKYRGLENIVEHIKNDELTDVFNNSDLLYSSKDDIMELLDYLNIIFLKERKLEAVEIVEKTKRKILANNNYDMCIDNLLMLTWESMHLSSK